MKLKVTKDSSWRTAENKFKGLEADIEKTIKMATEGVPKDYQKEIRNQIAGHNMEPESKAFSAADYAQEVKVAPEKESGVDTVFVGLSEPVKPEMRDFALISEFESTQYMGTWRKVTNRFLDKLAQMREDVAKKLTSWR